MPRKARLLPDAQPRTGDRIHISTYVTPEIYKRLTRASEREQRSLSRLLAWGAEMIADLLEAASEDEITKLRQKHFTTLRQKPPK